MFLESRRLLIMKNRFFKIFFGCAAVSLLLAAAGCSRLSKTQLQVLLPEGKESARIAISDFSLDTTVAAVNHTVSFSVPSNPAVAGTVSVGTLSSQFVPDGTSLTIDLRERRPKLTSDKPGSVNARMQVNKDFEMRSASDFSKKVQSLRADESMPAEKRDSLIAAESVAFQKLVVDEYLRRAKEEKDNYIGADAVVKLRGRIPNQQLDSLISTLAPAVLETGLVREAKNNVQALMNTEEGMHFKDFAIQDGDKEIHLSDYVGKGKFVLVDFWASWSRPSLAMMPFVRQVYDRFEGDHLMVLGIGAWDLPENTKAMAGKLDLPWTCLHDGTPGARAYGIYELPNIILFSPDGEILRRDLRGEDIVKAVERYLQ